MILALYLRLSKEDDDVIDESNSITNQRYILRNYVEERKEFAEYELVEYVDDGYSGKNFERPEVKRLLRDVKNGKVYGIMVKAFSRFGRNYIEVGDYLEKIFPLLGVRFISVNNRFDSIDYDQITPSMDVSFENLMYDYFSEESSVKIKNDVLKKRMRGNYIASFAPFGYKKSPKNNNQLVIDEEAAEVVRLIFTTYAECGVKAEVARILDKRNIPTPQEYAVKKGISGHWKYENEKKLWNSSIVGRIIRNQVYIGNMVFHKKEAAEVGSKKQRGFPKEEWKICENTHEAIVSKELFTWVNSEEFKAEKLAQLKEKKEANGLKKKKKKRSSIKSSVPSLLKGIIKCGGCRHCLVYRMARSDVYYCRHYYELKPPGCYSQNIREADVLKIIKEELVRQAALAADLEGLMNVYRETVKEKGERRKKERDILQHHLQKLRDKNFSFYESYRAGKINQEEFQELRQKSQEQMEYYQERLSENLALDVQDKFEPMEIFTLLKGNVEELELTREVIKQLVSEIYVYDDNRIEVIFKFEDELKRIAEITEFAME